MIEADGIVVGREAAALAALKGEMGLAAGELDTRGVEELSRVFGSRRSKVAALLELFGLAFSDADFEARELTLIASVANTMGVRGDELVAIEQWVHDHVALVKRAMKLMRE
jgi:hypothetical protein